MRGVASLKSAGEHRLARAAASLLLPPSRCRTLLRVACPWQLREWVALPLLHLPPAAHGGDERDWLDSVALRSPLELLHEGAPSPRRAAPPSPRRAAPQAIYPNHAVPLSCHSCLARPPAASRWLVARRPYGKARCSWKARRGDLYTCMCAAPAGPTHRTRWPLAARRTLDSLAPMLERAWQCTWSRASAMALSGK